MKRKNFITISDLSANSLKVLKHCLNYPYKRVDDARIGIMMGMEIKDYVDSIDELSSVGYCLMVENDISVREVSYDIYGIYLDLEEIYKILPFVNYKAFEEEGGADYQLKGIR